LRRKVKFGDKVGHFTLYGILTLLLDQALFRARPDQSRLRLAVICGLILALFIGLEELSQKDFPSRTFDLVDLTFSHLGVAFFSWVALKI
jgi:polysaccharide biosynthesis protein VpsQ